MTFIEEFNEIWNIIQFGAGDEIHDRRRNAEPQLLSLISELEKRGYFLGAGMASAYSILMFFGDYSSMEFLAELAIKYFEKNILSTEDSLGLALSHIAWANVYKRFQFPHNPQNINLQAKYIYHRRTAAETLTTRFTNDHNKDALLISGCHLLTDFVDQWDLDFVNYEVEEGHSSHNDLGLELAIPGAFQILVSIPDYEKALEVAERVPEGFKYPGVSGWREVCRGVMAKKEEAHKHYSKAAQFFAGDTLPEEGVSGKKPYWSALNIQTLAPYFRARAALSKPHSNSEEVIEALKIASNEIKPNQSGFVHLPARKLAILVHGLGRFLGTNDESVVDELAQDYQKEIDLWGQYTEDDKILLEGLSLVKQSIEGFRYDPVQEVVSGRLSQGIRILEAIPEWSQLQFVLNLVDPIARTTLEISQGVTYDDVAQLLETITDEITLRQLVLELLRVGVPYHAKVTHGPIEFGKDVIAIVDDGGTPRLHMYAMKAGDIDSRKWASAKEAIDQMFTVSIDNPLVTQYQPASVHGFLVFNGHFNQHIDPVANAWIDELRSKRNWNIQICDVDGISKWIVSNRLVNAMRKFMNKLGTA